MTREEYVAYVAALAGFHTPPDYVRALIELLHTERHSPSSAFVHVMEYLQTRPATNGSSAQEGM